MNFFISLFSAHFFDIFKLDYSIEVGFLTLFWSAQTNTTISREARANGRT